MSCRSLVLINFIIIPALVRLVAKEVNRRVLDAANVLFFFEMLQAVSFVPAGGEDVEGDLATDGVAVVKKGLTVGQGEEGCKDERFGGPRCEGGRGVNVRKAKVTEFLFQGFDEFCADLMFLVVSFVVVSFLCACVAADGGDVDHAVSIEAHSQPKSLNFKSALRSPLSSFFSDPLSKYT